MDFDWIFINDYKYPVSVLGPEKRIVVWTQGCSIRCKGCMSKHTWEFDEDKKVNIYKFVSQLKNLNIKNITISGGEPFDQKNLKLFLQELRKNGFNDILVYSGYKYEYIKKTFKSLLYYIDVLISEPFEDGNESELKYKGSNNQKAIVFNKNIYPKYENFLNTKKDKTIEIFDNLIVGIPYQKDIKRILNG